MTDTLTPGANRQRCLRDLGLEKGAFVGPIKVREGFLGPEPRFGLGRTELHYRALDGVADVVFVSTCQFEGMVGARVSLREVFGVLQKTTLPCLTVLFTGGTGTGRELARRAVHVRSRRAEGLFVVSDCAAAPEILIERALLGHVRGAVTGAVEARQRLAGREGF